MAGVSHLGTMNWLRNTNRSSVLLRTMRNPILQSRHLRIGTKPFHFFSVSSASALCHRGFVHDTTDQMEQMFLRRKLVELRRDRRDGLICSSLCLGLSFWFLDKAICPWGVEGMAFFLCGLSGYMGVRDLPVLWQTSREITQLRRRLDRT